MATAFPRWAAEPVLGVGTVDAQVPELVVRTLSGVGDELGVPLSSIVLAAHAKVLSLLTGDDDVVTGYAGLGGALATCRLMVGPGSWRALVLEADRGAREARPGTATETAFVCDGADLSQSTVLGVELIADDGCVLRVRHRTDALDEAAGRRIAGYHVAALESIGADLDAGHMDETLLSWEELELQLDGLAGPPRDLPERRAHELFEERVRDHPDAVAVVHRGVQWTYGELNARANRLARALRERGLSREAVVAVVTERNLDWVASVLAIFKAGGAYLPIEPHFPADRIARTLSRADCRLVMTESASTAQLDRALDSVSDVEKLLVSSAYEEHHDDSDLGIEVTPDQLAYIYFTSGSTGEPKGAMCEHGGMLNHLFAKIDDLEIVEGQAVAQVAPQCFDISLWQMLAALLVGGRTVVVEQEAILEVEQFVDRIAGEEVSVLQVVPSFLDVLLSYLDGHPRALPTLRCVSVTGEPLKKELVERWLAAMPGVKLVNAYGLTETSDDTNHEVMDRPPDGDRVPLGRAVNNVRVYVVDERLRPVPLGAPGEIVFSGVCVGRGYINDPERTRSAFVPDPHRAGERLYRSGDYGRWRPDGKLEFLGRRDSQVKVSGFRIEIGEIENTLLRVAGVRDAAVVVTGSTEQSKRLAAFYSSDRAHDADILRARLGEALPDYMIPFVFHWRENLPLTANGKVDRKALTKLAAELDVAETADAAPATATERRLAAAWAEVLGIPEEQISRHDHFFDRGGTSLAAVKLAIRLDRVVSIKDITGQPVLADLAAVVDGKSRREHALLQRLSEAGADAGALVCFPYAGGNAMNFQSLATALRGSGLAVYAVELPGHDLAAEREPFVSLNDVVDQVVREVEALRVDRLLLWGHSSGAAFVIETARRLEQRATDVARVFLAAQLPGAAEDRRAAAAALGEHGDREIAQRLSAEGGYTELRELDDQRAQHVGAAYRHDFLSANRYLADAVEAPPAEKLTAPVTIVAAADDPATPQLRERFREWELFADHVELHELADGGHYFLRTRPEQSAQAVARVCGAVLTAN